jgi:hypothetical protein
MRITLAMQRKPPAEKIKSKLRKTLNASVVYESDYVLAEDNARVEGTDVVLIEIAETGKYDVDYCLGLCSRLSGRRIKLMLLCPEQDESVVSAVINAKRQGLIDDFMFYDASVDYIVSKLIYAL